MGSDVATIEPTPVPWIHWEPGSSRPSGFATHELIGHHSANASQGLLIFIAAFLVANRELFTVAGTWVLGMTVPGLRDLGPLLMVTLVSVLVLVYEKNLGFSLLVFGTGSCDCHAQRVWAA